MGIPGFSGFAAEITILIGTWKAYPVAVWITGVGMVLVAAFTLRALKRILLCECCLAQMKGRPPSRPMSNCAITLPEKLGAGLLMFATLAVGLYPKLLLDRITPAVEAMRFLQP